jgi:hypothetical protein
MPEDMVSQEQVRDMTKLVQDLLTDQGADLVKTYFAERAGATFNTIGANDPYAINEDDLLAVHMLNVPITPPMVRRLLQDADIREEISGLLFEIHPCVPLWGDEAETALAKADELWHVLDGVPDVGWVIAGKILARKRPHLIPVADERVWEYLKPKKGLFWETLRSVFRQDGMPEEVDSALRIEILRTPEMRARISTLRLLDIAVWMQG